MNYQHLILKVSCRTPERMFDDRLLENALIGACHKAGAHVLRTAQHHFYPQGFTMAVLLAESHATIHSFPENNESMIDFFSCSEDPKFDLFTDFLFEYGFDIVSSTVMER